MRLRTNTLPAITGFLVALAGITSLAQVITIHIRHHRFGRIDDSLLPFTPAQNSRLLIIIIGIFLLYLSLQIFRRKRRAFVLVGLGLSALIVAEVLGIRNYAQLSLYLLTLLVLLVTHRQYTVASNNLSLRRGVVVALSIIAVVFLYAAIGFAQLSDREVGRNLTAPDAAKYAAREIFTFQEIQLPLNSRHARWFVASVNGAAAAAYTLAVVSLFQPLKFQYGASRREQELARHVLEKFSRSTEDYFKLWPLDKHYYFSADEDSFIAYKVVGRDALVLGDPSGNPESFPRLIRDFTDFATRSGWAVSALYASEDFDDWDGGSFQRVFIGNEAVIDAALFAESTHRSKHFRYIRNRAERDGLSFGFWHAPLTDTQLQALRRISDSWLGNGSHREYTFALGYFDDDYIRGCDIAILTRGGEVVAYANIIPAMLSDGRSIDHMRYTADMPSTGMHYLLMQLILHLHEQGIKTFNLGLAPLSGLEKRETSTMPERLLAVIKRLGSLYYSFGGLEQFKNKFEPDWQPRYLYYPGPPTNLIRITRHLSQALTLPAAGRYRRLLLVSLSIVAALCYASFPLALFTDPDRILHGLVSQLGSGGEAYAGLYNGLDVASGILILVVVGLLWARLKPGAGLARQTLLLFSLGAVGTILAAVTPLPLHMSDTTQRWLHDFFSGLNIIGICGAAWGTTLLGKRRPWLMTLFTLVISTSLLFVIAHGTLIGSVAQRFQIIFTSAWIIIVSVTLSSSTATEPVPSPPEPTKIKSQGFIQS